MHDVSTKCVWPSQRGTTNAEGTHKESYISAKEPYISAKEPYTYPRYVHNMCVAVAECDYKLKVLIKSPIYPPKSPIYPPKSPIYPPKRPTYQPNSPITPPTSPIYPLKSPTHTHDTSTKCVWPSQSVTTNARYS